MKLKFMMFIFLSVLSTFSINASAQEFDPVAKATIPFAFYAGGQKMPAGTYTVGLDLVNGMTSLRDATGQKQIFLLGNPADGGEDKNELVFEHTGNVYVLKEVRDELLDVSFQTKIPAEAMATRSASSPVEVALNHM